MQNTAEFHIIGRVGNIEDKEKVTFLSVASNTNYKKDGEWEQITNWNSVTIFTDQLRERINAAEKGDLVRIIGNVRQSSRDVDGQKQYQTDLIAEGFAILARKSSDEPDDS